jgi:peptidyl-prolyl cis-trans isomerase B (cyclophilin B)
MDTTRVLLSTTKGDLVLELDREKAPLTVENFLSYVDSGFFDGTVFHRVIPGFMVQGGGFVVGMDQKKTKEPIKNEAKNGLKNLRGTIAMARTSDPHSATAQFFINLVDNAFLNRTGDSVQGAGYCVFGKVASGMEAVDAIAAVPTGNRGPHGDVPVEDVLIVRATRQA